MNDKRERTSSMTIDDLRLHFHRQAHLAAKRLNICPTAFKGLCRKLRLVRWPYRKISSIKRKIAVMRRDIRSKAVCGKSETVKRLMEDIAREKAKIADIYANPFLPPEEEPKPEGKGKQVVEKGEEDGEDEEEE